MPGMHGLKKLNELKFSGREISIHFSHVWMICVLWLANKLERPEISELSPILDLFAETQYIPHSRFSWCIAASYDLVSMKVELYICSV